MNLKKFVLNRTCYYFDGINKFKDFYFDNILIDEKSFLFYKKYFDL